MAVIFFITCWLADRQMIKAKRFSIFDIYLNRRRRRREGKKGAENVGSSIEAKAKKMQLYKMRERSHLFFCGLLSCPPFNFPFVMCLYKKGPIDGLGQRGVENKTQTFIEKIRVCGPCPSMKKAPCLHRIEEAAFV